MTLNAVVKESATGTVDGVKLISIKNMIAQIIGKTSNNGKAKSSGIR